MNNRYIVLYSGGHSSALVAIEAVRRYGKENVILLNHDISATVEHEDIKRFKKEVADYLGLSITYANMQDYEHKDQFDICIAAKAFKYGIGRELCTRKLKTEPFANWLKVNYPVTKGFVRMNVVFLYGFDREETNRIERRKRIMLTMGYRTDFPLAYWDRTIHSTEEIGIKKPKTYEIFRHANCIGCLKAGRQSWYVTYCLRPDIWEKAKYAESQIGYSIIKGIFLKDLEPKFKKMKEINIVPSEKLKPQTFWKLVNDALPDDQGRIQIQLAI